MIISKMSSKGFLLAIIALLSMLIIGNNCIKKRTLDKNRKNVLTRKAQIKKKEKDSTGEYM